MLFIKDTKWIVWRCFSWKLPPAPNCKITVFCIKWFLIWLNLFGTWQKTGSFSPGCRDQIPLWVLFGWWQLKQVNLGARGSFSSPRGWGQRRLSTLRGRGGCGCLPIHSFHTDLLDSTHDRHWAGYWVYGAEQGEGCSDSSPLVLSYSIKIRTKFLTLIVAIKTLPCNAGHMGFNLWLGK